MRLKIITLLYSLFFVSGTLYSATAVVPENSGCRYIRNFNQENYGFAAQNWVILQDSRGIIYTANQAGVLEYDGAIWGGIILPRTRSMDMADSGTIYVGGKDEVGFIDSKPDGSPVYVSLRHYLHENEREFGWVMRTNVTQEGVYFRTSK
jgi:hypothetical protein